MALTKRNHSNPCFWTAFWNRDYYEGVVNGGKTLPSRQQRVYSLNAKADKVIRTTVSNVHCDKWIGVAEITPDAMKDFCRRYHPERYEQFVEDMEDHPESVYLDIENLWTTLECTAAYQALLGVLKRQRLELREDKVNLACFIVLQAIRSHAMLQSMLELAEKTGMPRFEHYWHLKNMLSDPSFLFSTTAPILYSQWILYATEEHTFPLPDTPVMTGDRNIMVALSPCLLLEVDLKGQGTETSWIQQDGISPKKYYEYRRRCISNTFKEIIFCDRATLERWRVQSQFRRRVSLLSEQKSFNALVEQSGNRQIWKINAFGNLDAQRIPEGWEYL